MTKRDFIRDADEYIEVVVEISCCDCTDTLYHVDEDAIASNAYDDGWRIVGNKLLCKKCAKTAKEG